MTSTGEQASPAGIDAAPVVARPGGAAAARDGAGDGDRPAAGPGRAPSGAGGAGSSRRLLTALAAVAYVPLLLTSPGWVSADTKTYLYLDPTRLLSRAWSMWDPAYAAGGVTHQAIGFLWPMGPWYWLADAAGLPDWVAQRLWWGTLIWVAGAGVAYLLRTMGWPASGAGATAAVFVYALTPYTLTLVARLSGILLPFSGLPWLLGLTIRALRHRGWRHPALFALAVATFGSVNATALVLALVGPASWLAYAVAVRREVTWRRAAVTAAKLGVLTAGVSAWWFAGLTVQATHGINIIRYTETAEVVAATSTSHEVLRGLGYWFFYGGDRLGPWIEPSASYTQRPVVIVLSYLVPLLCLAGAAMARWRDRAFFVALAVTGTALAVGAFPRDHNPPFGRLVQLFQTFDVGLALRSLPRAVPLMALGLAVLLGGGTTGLVRRWPHLDRPATVAVAAVAVLALPPLWLGQFVPENLRRPEEVPAYWQDAAHHLDGRDDGTRVLVIPGSDFASYRWGNTVDPILPGLMDRPSLQREVAPYGSPASVNLLNAFDLRLQERTLDADALAPVARLVRAGDLLVVSDWQYERYNTPRPRNLWALVDGAPGLGPPTGFGPAEPNRTVPDVQLDDELLLLTDPGIPDPPEVAAFPVPGVLPVVAAQPADHPLLVAGDGAGLVDAAAAGLIDGSELIRYSASLGADEVTAALDDGAALLVTDTNRKRGERWGSLRHTRGYTETADGGPLADDLTDNRMPLFPGAGTETMSVTERGAAGPGTVTVEAEATSYGNSISFGPEERPSLAVDGDPATAWRAGGFADARGERLELRFSRPVTTDHITLLQPTEGARTRFITRARLHFGPDGGDAVDVALSGQSRDEPGEVVRFPRRRFSTLSIEILADSAGRVPGYAGQSSVGFAEVEVDGVVPAPEAVRLPTDLLAAAGPASQAHPLAITVTRQRQDPTEPTRTDEEPALARVFSLPTGRSFALGGEARLSARADPAVLDELLGRPHDGTVPWVRAGEVLSGALATPAAAFDGDPASAWTTQRSRPRGQWIEVVLPAPVTVDRLPLTVVADGLHSVPTEVELSVDGEVVGRFPVPEVTDGDRQNATTEATVDIPRVSGSRFRLRLTGVREQRTNDWVSDRPVAQPAAIAEIGLPGPTVPPLPASFDSGCRDDLLELDGRPVPVRITGSTADALAARPLTVATCDRDGGRGGAPAPGLDLPAGARRLDARPGRASGIDLDQLVLRSGAGGGASASDATLVGEAAALDTGAEDPGVPRVEVTRDDRHRVRLHVSGATPGTPFWLVLGQSFNTGWQATAGGEALGDPELVDGFANGWRVDPRDGSFDVTLEFTPQRRVTGALWLSAAAAAACLLLVLRRPRPAVAVAPAVPEALVPGALAGYRGPPLRLPATCLAAMAVGGSGVILAGPGVGAIAGVAAAVAARRDGARRLLLLGSPTALGVAVAYVLYIQVRHAPPPSFSWPHELRRVHPLGWLAVMLLVADVAVAGIRGRSRRDTPHGSGAGADPPPPGAAG